MEWKIKIVAVSGTLAIILGAFGAHILKPILEPTQLDSFRTGSMYHFLHMMPMMLIAFRQGKSKILDLSFYLFMTGLICFSGSLYVLSTKQLYGGNFWNFLGPITPIGGLLLMGGWLNLWRLSLPARE